ncbi:MAG: hypothetical protein JWO66_2448 [Candidatus Eremiobacteraeota bacterium]|nr:hypothetical protein [Candidatus Eremiobacteraeota bacterium]
MPSIEFRCSTCKQPKDVRTLRGSVCEDCRSGAERTATAQADAATEQRAAYRAKIEGGPHYSGPLETWTPSDPVLLADGEHFVCSSCRRAAHLVHDLQHRWEKTPFPIPTKKTVCDVCRRKDADEAGAEKTAWRNRFSRER